MRVLMDLGGPKLRTASCPMAPKCSNWAPARCHRAEKALATLGLYSHRAQAWMPGASVHGVKADWLAELRW